MSISTEIQRIMTAKANIKTAIENKGVTVGDETIDTYAEKIGEIVSGDYDQGYEDGKNSVIPLERYAKTISFYSFNVFKEKVVELNLDHITTFFDLVRVSSPENTNTTVEHFIVNCPNLITNMLRAFECNSADCSDLTLKKLTLNVDTQKSTSFSTSFDRLQALEIIDGTPLNFTSATVISGFYQCYALKEVRVVANTIKVSFSMQHSDKLSTDTIQSIIDGLADLTGGTAQTLTLHATVGAKLTDEQKATITAKNWTLVY